MEGMDSVGFISCNGSPWSRGDMATLRIQHIFAGLGLLFWTLHWTIGAYYAYLMQTRQRPFISRTTYPILGLPHLNKVPVEAICKVVLPLIVIVGQIAGRDNVCSAASARAGHFDPDTIFRYADVWILVSIILSGLVDLIGSSVPLPHGTERFFLALAFMLQTFVLATGYHLDMLEDMVYFMLFLVSAGTTVCLLAEILWPESFLLSCGRSYFTFMQAIWFFGAARILYEGRPAWSTREPLPDMAPSMFVPMPFVFWMNATSSLMFAGLLLMRFINRASIPQGAAEYRSLQFIPSETSGDEGAGPFGRSRTERSSKEARGEHELVPLVPQS